MITKDTLLSELLSNDNADKIVEVLMSVGMHCFGCPASQMESLEEACSVHGLDCTEVLSKINACLAA